MAKKVLVVDDEKLIVKGIRFSLEQDGMEVDCAYDGEEALNMAKANEYDMILLDIILRIRRIFGSMMSKRIISYSFAFAIFSASSPSYAQSTSIPSCSRLNRIPFTINFSSSTTRTFFAILHLNESLYNLSFSQKVRF